MRGRPIPLSMPRRIVTDLMRFSIRVPTAPVHRRMKLGAVIAARAQLAVRPPWTAIFVKGYALVAQEVPDLRRVYLLVSLAAPLRIPGQHRHASRSNATSRGERAVFGCLIAGAEVAAAGEIGARIATRRRRRPRRSRTSSAPCGAARLPLPIRRSLMWIAFNIGALRGRYVGTFAIAELAALGADSTILLSIWTAALTYGPLDSDGSIDVGVTADHRVLDGATAARVLARLEDMLNGPMAQELQGASTA